MAIQLWLIKFLAAVNGSHSTESNKPLAYNLTVDFFRALKAVVMYIAKAYEML